MMYNNVIVMPFLPKIADCAQQDHVLDLTRPLAVGKGSGSRDYSLLTLVTQIKHHGLWIVGFLCSRTQVNLY